LNTQFSAASQALGYLYQAIYALYLILDNPEESELAIERLDDIDFDKNGSSAELLQLKHHTTHQASLTDSSPDLWKTIRIWSSHLQQGNIFLPDTILSLVTTATAPDNSIASHLRPDSQRNPELACEKLIEIADTSENKKLAKAFEAFKALSSQQQLDLIKAIHILDGSPNIIDVTDLIKEKIKLSVRREHRDGLYHRLQGWWLDKVILHLKNNSADKITGFEVYDKIAFISEQFKPDALPIDFINAEPSMEYNWSNRIFVLQLKEIDINSRRIEKAILDYYRAFEQRSRWAREELLFGDDLEIYETKLIDEWERYYDRLSDDFMLENDCSIEEADEKEHKKFGHKIYGWMEEENIHIRPQVTEPYVMQGSYHMLADEDTPCIWWHPMFLDRLKTLLADLEV